MMERFVVGLTTVALLVSAMGHGRTDYVVVCQIGDPGNDGQFSDSQDLPVSPSGNLLAVKARNQRPQLFATGSSFLTKFDNPGSAGGQHSGPAGMELPTLGNVIAGDRLKQAMRPFTSDGTFLSDFASLGMGGLQFRIPSGLDGSSPGEVLVADTMDHRSETTSGDAYIARFGSQGIGEMPRSEPDRLAIALSGNGSVPDGSDHKLVLIMSLIALGVLGTLGYLWRRRRRRVHRALRGPRRTAVYRSPSLPNPPGTLR